MDVDDDHGRRRLRLLDEVVDQLPHAVRRVEEERPEQVDDRDGGAVAGRDDGEPAAGRIALEVRRPHDRLRRRQVGADLLAPPRVVSQRDGICTCGQQPLREAWRDPDAVRDVLAVHDARVCVHPFAQRREQTLDRVASRATDDVADEEEPHG